MQGIKIFSFRRFSVLLVLLSVLVSQKAPGQSTRDRGNFFARRLTAAAGLAYSLQQDNVPAAAGVNFSPRLFLMDDYPDFSFSFDTDIMANYRLDGSENDFTNKIFFQLPAVVNVNIGHGASKDFQKAVGGFLGAGWNLQYDGSRTVNGFALHAGFRFWLLGKSFTLRFIHLPGSEKIFSSGKIISLQINLGKYLENVKANNKVSNFMKPYRK